MHRLYLIHYPVETCRLWIEILLQEELQCGGLCMSEKVDHYLPWEEGGSDVSLHFLPPSLGLYVHYNGALCPLSTPSSLGHTRARVHTHRRVCSICPAIHVHMVVTTTQTCLELPHLGVIFHTSCHCVVLLHFPFTIYIHPK